MLLDFLHKFIEKKLGENNLLSFVNMIVCKEDFRIIVTLQNLPVVTIEKTDSLSQFGKVEPKVYDIPKYSSALERDDLDIVTDTQKVFNKTDEMVYNFETVPLVITFI